MAITFENTPLRWDNAGIEPSESLKTNGFQAGYKPPASVFNRQINNTSACITEIQEKVSSHTHSTSEITGTLPVSKGGTGQSSLTAGHVLLGGGSNSIGSIATLPLTKGGTGATSAANARINLGVEGTSLYSNASGTSGTITLSEDVGIFRYLQINFRNYQNYRGSARIGSYGNWVLHHENYTTATSPSSLAEARVNIMVSGTTITFDMFYTFTTYTDGTISFSHDLDSDKLKITEVIGYKY